MRIIYIHQFFTTNQGSGGTRSYDVAKHMVNAGHKIHMICGICDVSGLEPLPWYKLFRKQNIDGIDVTICNVPYSNNLSMLKRLMGFVWFSCLATLASLRVKKPDIVFATSTPLTVGIPGYLAAKIKKAAFIFEVRDIMPEAYIESGAMKPGPAVWIAERLEAFIYNKALKIMLVSPGFEKRLKQRGMPAEKLKTVPLGADSNLFVNVKPDYSFLSIFNSRINSKNTYN